MLFTSLSACLLLALRAAASPVVDAKTSSTTFIKSTSTTSAKASSTTSKCSLPTVFIDTYDDLPPPVPGVPEAEQVGIYHGLNYSIFDYGPQGILPKVVPVSAPNLATFTLVNTLAMGAVTTNPFSVITTSGSTASFDFLYFYFACGQVTGTNLAGVATGCGITITGFCKNGQRAPDASFNYAPTSTNNAPLTLATLPLYYVDLKNVTIAISTSTVLTSATLFLMDNLAHRNYYC